MGRLFSCNYTRDFEDEARICEYCWGGFGGSFRGRVPGWILLNIFVLAAVIAFVGGCVSWVVQKNTLL
jgi:hypothetical protein